MASTDQDFNGIVIAVQTQAAFGTVDPECKALSGALSVGDGIVLGDKNSGDGETGITFPNLSAIVREVAQVSASFTQQADSFIREAVEGLSITFPLQGNGATSSQSADEAQPDAGIDAILGAAGLVGATGAVDPDYIYTPRATVEYCTVHLWVADLDFILQDCLVETLVIASTAGANALITANFKVGAMESYNDGVTFPTPTWGTQSSLAAPTVEGVNFNAFGLTRGFQDELAVTITNGIEEFGDSNVDITGIRQSQTDRIITVDGRLYLNGTNSAAEHDALVSTSAITDDLTFQLGTADPGSGTPTLNAALITVAELQAKDIKYDRTGTATVVEISGAKATGSTAGSEFSLTYN
jgi:hypothetical protein